MAITKQWQSFDKYLKGSGWGTGFKHGIELGNFIQQQPTLTSAILSSAPSVATGGGQYVAPGAESEEPGIIDRLFASLDAPQNAIVNDIKTFTEPRDVGESFLGDITGKIGEALKTNASAAYQISPLNALPKFVPGESKLDTITAEQNPAASTADFLTSDYFKEHGFQRAALGFIGDIATDPLTYVPGGALKGLFKSGSEHLVERAAIDAAKTTPESIIEHAAAGDAPIVHGINVPTAPVNAADEGVQIAARTIERRPLRQHAEELFHGVTNPGADRYLSEEASHLASPALGAKLTDETSLLNDSRLADHLNPSTAEEVAAAAKVKSLHQALAPAVAAGADLAGDAVAPIAHSAIFQDLVKSAKETTLTPTGKISAPKAWDSLIRMQKRADDHIIDHNAALGDAVHPAQLPLMFHGEGVKISDILARMPKPKTEAQFNEAVTQIARDYGKGGLTAETHPAIRSLVHEQQAAKIMARPEFMQNLGREMQTRAFKAQQKLGVAAADLPPEEITKIIGSSARQTIKNSAMRVQGANGKQLALKDVNAIAKVVQKHLTDVPVTHMQKLYADAAKASAKGKVAQGAVDAVTREIEGTYGPFKKMKDVLGRPMNVQGTILSRHGTMLQENLSTGYGTLGLGKDIRAARFAGEGAARTRALKGRELIKKFPPEARREAWEAVKGNKVPGSPFSSVEAEQAYYHINDWATHIMGNSHLGRMGMAQRSNMLMKDANEELGRIRGFKEDSPYKFHNDKFTDENGKEWDFRSPEEGGEGWWMSYKSWPEKPGTVNDPVNILYDMDLALERRASLYSALEDAGERFGRRQAGGEYVHQVMRGKEPHAILENYHFPKEIADALKKLDDFYIKGAWAPSHPFTRFLTKGMRAWKSGVTIYSPSHHIRNFIGDTWMTWMAGHSDPTDFYRAARVMKSQRRAYHDAIQDGSWEDLAGFTDPRFNAENGSVIIGKKGKIKHDITAGDLYQSAFKRGLLRNVDQIEDIAADGVDAIGGSPLKALHHKIGNAAEYREHTVRMHHYIAAVRKELKKGRTDLEKIYDEAGYEVNKWHPDGTDMTYFEQKWMRNIIPFYSWQRKAIPLLMEGLLTSPSKIMAYPRAQYALSDAMGMQEGNDQGLLDPFPDSQLYPSWMRAAGVGPLGLLGGSGLSGAIGGLGNQGEWGTSGSTVINPGNPFNDVVSQYTGIGKPFDWASGILQGVNPAARIPFELAQGSKTTGAPIKSGADIREYLAEQLPPVAIASRLFPNNFTNPSGVEKYGHHNLEAIINYLTAAGVQGSGQWSKTSQYEARDRGN